MGVCVGNVSNIEFILIMLVFAYIITSVIMMISDFKIKVFTPSIIVQMSKVV